jgi:hypothetical protein
MVAITISLLVLASLVGLLVNTSRNNTELAKTNSMLENGRLAMQVLQIDVEHAGFWGGYLPQFDDFTSSVIPGDVPNAVPNPCQPYNTWSSDYVSELLGIPVQAYDTLPVGAGCLSPLPQHANTDVLLIRHADVCVAGAGTCAPQVAGALYFQSSFCAAEQDAGTARSAGPNTIALATTASATAGAYVGLVLHTVGGTGSGQFRRVSAYSGLSQIATVTDNWTISPDNTTIYAFPYVLGTAAYPLYKRNCVGTGSPQTLPITAGSNADVRKFISDLYYVTDYPDPDFPGQLVPTLVRSQFDLANATLAHQAAVPLVDGVEAFRVFLGIDNVSKTGNPVDYTQAIIWQDPTDLIAPVNRGDGVPDQYVSCTTAVPCTVAQLVNVVTVKVYALVRDRDVTAGYVDGKTYCLGPSNTDGSCPVSQQYLPNDSYKRHLFTTTIRVNNVSGRRNTPNS